MKNCIIVLICFVLPISACQKKTSEKMGKSFKDDIEFLQKYTDAFVLKEPEGNGQIIVIPQYQARIMTSTLDGGEGPGFGWINYDLIQSGEIDDRFNAYGGEDRFWLGPEGGQFSLYHNSGGPFDLDNWFVPPQVDTQPFKVDSRSNQEVSMSVQFTISNYSNTEFAVKVTRNVRIFNKSEILSQLGLESLENCMAVGFESENTLRNTDSVAWAKEKGLMSIWILGMYNPGNNVVIVLPYYQGGIGSLGEVVNDQYFGEVPANRLKSSRGVVYFKGDGKYRSKIGMNWLRAKDILGSYDPDRKVLTIVKYNKPEEEAEYVKALWEIMDDPYDGDVINSYNDGVPGPGAEPLGPFYELETSSPVRELQPGEELLHVHQTFHIQGEETQLNHITEKLFNVKIQNIKDAFIH
jgi:hypothetical protein